MHRVVERLRPTLATRWQRLLSSLQPVRNRFRSYLEPTGVSAVKRDVSLGWHLVKSHLLACLLVLTVASAVFWAAMVTEVKKYEQARHSQMEATALDLIRESSGPPLELLQRLRRAMPGAEVTMHDSNPLSVAIGPSNNRIVTVTSQRQIVSLARWHEGVLVIPYSRTDHGFSYFQFRPLSPIQEQAKGVFIRFVTILTVGVAFAMLLSWWLGRRLTRPLQEMAQVTKAVAEGDFGQRLGPTGVIELNDLGARFNHMAAQLEESFRQLRHERDIARRFAGDAAHELKTPLTALKTYAEVAQTGTGERRQQAMGAVLRQVQRLEHLVSGLLQLSTLSEGTEANLEKCDLLPQVEALLPACEAMAQHHGHRFSFKCASAFLPVRLDRKLLELVVTNLVENGCKFTPAGGAISVSLGCTDADAFLTVSDTGPGIPSEELPYIFDRFRRGLGTQNVPGSGLGLSIVGRAVERMGGNIEVSSREGQGTRFTLYLRLLD